METNQNTLEITKEIRSLLSKAAGWAHFIAIVGFVMVGFMLLMSLVIGSVLQNLNGNEALGIYEGMPVGAISLLYVFIAIIYFFPILYLFQFSKRMRAALREDDQELLLGAFKGLKSHYKFIGIMTIIMISLYLLILLVTIVGGALGAMAFS